MNPRTPKFSAKLKIHKLGNSGRPVVNSIKSPTEKISGFVGSHLQPVLTDFPSYVRDTKDLLHKIKTISNVSEETNLVAMAVKSFMTTFLTRKEL